MVHRNFQLFSAVLVANEHTHFGDMSSFVQDLTKSDCKKVTWWTWHLSALQVFGFAKHKGDMVDMSPLCSASFWICTAQR